MKNTYIKTYELMIHFDRYRKITGFFFTILRVSFPVQTVIIQKYLNAV